MKKRQTLLVTILFLALAGAGCGGGNNGGGGGTTPADTDVLNATLSADKVKGFNTWFNGYDRAKLADAGCRMFGLLKPADCATTVAHCTKDPAIKALAGNAALEFTAGCDLKFSDAKTFITLLKDVPDSVSCKSNIITGLGALGLGPSWDAAAPGKLQNLTGRLTTCIKR
jgi:hypothetical protein